MLSMSDLTCILNLPFPKQQNLDNSERKEFAGNNFKFAENER